MIEISRLGETAQFKKGAWVSSDAGLLALVLDPADPITAARVFVSRHYTVDDTLTLRRQQGVFYIRWRVML